jgi:hypothetical protein
MSKASTRTLNAGDNVRIVNDPRSGVVSNVGRYDVTVRVLNAGKIEHRRFDRGALLWQAPVVAVPVVNAIVTDVPDAHEAIAI